MEEWWDDFLFSKSVNFLVVSPAVVYCPYSLLLQWAKKSIFLHGEFLPVTLAVAQEVGALLGWFECLCNPSSQEAHAGG